MHEIDGEVAELIAEAALKIARLENRDTVTPLDVNAAWAEVINELRQRIQEADSRKA